MFQVICWRWIPKIVTLRSKPWTMSGSRTRHSTGLGGRCFWAAGMMTHLWYKNVAKQVGTEIYKTFSFYVSPMSIVDLLIHEMPDRSCLVSSAQKAIGFWSCSSMGCSAGKMDHEDGVSSISTECFSAFCFMKLLQDGDGAESFCFAG